MKPYQFVLLRYMHSASSGEFINIGVVVWVPDERRLFTLLNERYGRLSKCFADFDGTAYRRMVSDLASHFDTVAGQLAAAQLPLLEDLTSSGLESILPSLVPASPSSFQWSPIMGGVHREPAVRLSQLFKEFVERHEQRTKRPRREDKDIIDEVEKRLRIAGLAQRMEQNVEVIGPEFSWKFRYGWPNGKLNVLEAISLDYLHPSDMLDRAHIWSGRMLALTRARDFKMTGIVAPPADESLLKAYQQSIRILERAPGVQVVEEAGVDALLKQIAHDIKLH